MNDLLRYILLGFALSAPIGPINAAQIDRGMKYGFIHAWMVGLGAMCADILYMILIYFGLSNIFHIPALTIVLWMIGSIILMYLGLDTLLHIPHLAWTSTLNRESNMKSLLTGFFLAGSNPMNFIFWFGIYGSVLAETVQKKGHLGFIGNSSGIFIGIFIWDIAMALIASFLQKYATRRALQITSLLAGLSLIGFSGYFAFQIHQAIL